jgi:hypothetical protein
MWVPGLLTVSFAILLTACSVEPMGEYEAEVVEKFDYTNFEKVQLALQVVDSAGDGLVGVQVTIRRASTLAFDDPEYIPGKVLFRGRSGMDGKVMMPTSFPATTGDVEVVSQLKGYQGEYSEPKMLEDWGAFAPSSVVKAQLGDLESFTLLLAEKVR